MTNDPCPGEARLRTFLLGEGDPAELEAVGKHLEGCPQCETLVQALESQADTLLRELRDDTPSGMTSELAPADKVVADHSSGEPSKALPAHGGDLYSTFRGGSTMHMDVENHPLATNLTVRYFGDYEIRRVLGSGAMGVVYRARQVSLNRPVALKMIQAGIFADEAQLRRFQNEAEAVALLDHPGIVPIYEVGDHEGQRYFSMKLVEGGNLAERITSFKDDPRGAAAIVSEIADAVHHAHMRGILHRDLKPANILVDPAGHPHVTDFGLAKMVERDSEMTQSGMILGTPAYMSPEQADGHRGMITTASDVYGLGAILYGLLAGRAPFGGDGVIETLEAVRTKPPAPPRKLNPRVPRDLETICLKCLEKDPRRRFPSADSLANDLKAWLDARPIAARRVGIAERAWLWSKRRPAVAALAAGVMLAVVGGIAAVITVQAKANTDLLAANERVQARFELAREAIRSFQQGVNEDDMLKGKELKALRDKLLRNAAVFYEKLEKLLKDQTDRPSRAILAQSYAELGELTEKIGVQPEALGAHRKALAIRRELAASSNADTLSKLDLARSLNATGLLAWSIGEKAGALSALEEARDLAGPLAKGAGPADPARVVLGTCHHQIGDVLAKTGKSAEAMESYGRALAIWEKLAGDHPDVAEFQNGLARSHYSIGAMHSDTGHSAEALVSFGRALAIRAKLAEDHPAVTEFRSSLALSHNSISREFLKNGQLPESLQSLGRALTMLEKLAEDHPAVTLFRNSLAGIHFNIGLLRWKAGQPAESLESYGRALVIRAKLAEDHPAVADFRGNLAMSHNNIGAVLSDTGRLDEARESHRQAMTLRLKLVNDYPDVTEFRHGLALSYQNIGFVQWLTGHPAESLASYGKELAIRAKLARDDPAVTDYRSRLATTYGEVGGRQWEIGQPLEALVSFGQALALRAKLAEDSPAVAEFRDELALSHFDIGLLQSWTGHPTEAMKSHEKALALREKLAKDNAAVAKFRRGLANSLNSIGYLQWQAGQPVEALESLRRALEILQKLTVDDPTRPDYQNSLANCYTNFSDVLRGLCRLDEARDGYGRAIAIRERLVEAYSSTVRYRVDLASSFRRLGLARDAAGDFAGAVADARRALALCEGLPSRSGNEWYELACARSALSGLAAQGAPGTSAGEEKLEADRAMDLLRHAVADGYREARAMSIEAALEPFRSRPDFRLLMSDVLFPADPFAP